MMKYHDASVDVHEICALARVANDEEAPYNLRALARERIAEKLNSNRQFTLKVEA